MAWMGRSGLARMGSSFGALEGAALRRGLRVQAGRTRRPNAPAHTHDYGWRAGLHPSRQPARSLTGSASMGSRAGGCNGNGNSNGNGNGTGHDAADSLLSNPPDLTSPYTIFKQAIPEGPPPGGPFAISLPKLKRHFLQLQGGAHPDKYPPGPQKQAAEALSARINEAYQLLASPLSRAQFLLQSQHGIDVTSESGAKQHPQDSGTLMYVLGIQEEIEEAPDEHTIEKLKERNSETIEECVDCIADAFAAADVDRAVRETVRLRYLQSVQHGLHEWEPGKMEIDLHQ
ncbi:hypothetical protein KEM52_004514 [Ascosphaera acerosa]|nr:hypothetical protein KEM52_004514 [Ascosphaera acerosa]